MKLTRSAAALAALCLPALIPAADPIDINKAQFPPRPAPKWFKTVDLGSADPRLKGFSAAEGVKVEIVAEQPTVINPVSLAFDDDGALHVLERGADKPDAEALVTFTYKDGGKRAVLLASARAKDVVKVLRDTRGEGVFDAARVVVEDELLAGFLPHDGWLYLAGRGTVRRVRQSKPDGPHDVRELVAQGFGGFHPQQVSGIALGVDGCLHLTAGAGDNVVEGSDGSRATVWRSGAVFRCRPDGSKMHVHSLGYRNPCGPVAFDAAYNAFHVDDDTEGGGKFEGCRLTHVVEAADFGWRASPGTRSGTPDGLRAAAFGELPGKVPPLLKTGRGTPAGLTIVNDARFPEPLRGLLYYPDPLRNSVRAYRVEPDGSTFRVAEEFELLRSDDRTFQPTQMAVGPDGALYLCDRGDGKRGRIYRLSWAGTKDEPGIALRPGDSWSRLRKLSDEKLLDALGNEDFTDRQKARLEVVRRGEKLRPALLQLVADAQKHPAARIEAVGALGSFWNEDVRKQFCDLLGDPEPTLRRLAADGLALNGPAGDKETHEALLQHLGDDNPAARRAIILAVGRVGADGAADALVNALAFDEGKDVYLRDGLVRAIDRLGKVGVDRLVALGDSGVDKNIDRAVEAVCGLREPSGAAAIPVLLRNPHLGVAQRVALVKSYTNYLAEPPVPLTPLAEYLTGNREATEVKVASMQVFAAGGEGLTNEKARAWVLAQLDDGSTELRRAALAAVEAVRLKEAVPKLKTMLADDTRSAAERELLSKVLRSLEGGR